MRFEKAFQVDASALLDMQARYDEFVARAGQDDIAVRAYVPAYLPDYSPSDRGMGR